MLSRRQTSRAEPSTAAMMIRPPIVGVPFFCICPSSPRSRISSPIWWRCSTRMMRPPAKKAISMLMTAASMARKER